MMENAGNIILRQGGQAGLPGSVPPPQETPLPGEQERFEGLLGPGESTTQPAEASARIADPGPAQNGFSRPVETAANSGLTMEKTSAEMSPQSLRVSGDTILEGLSRMGDHFSPGLMPISGVAAPEGLLAARNSLARGGTSIELLNKVQSQADEGIEQLTKG